MTAVKKALSRKNNFLLIVRGPIKSEFVHIYEDSTQKFVARCHGNK